MLAPNLLCSPPAFLPIVIEKRNYGLRSASQQASADLPANQKALGVRVVPKLLSRQKTAAAPFANQG